MAKGKPAGTPKTGGREKGTPNKTQAQIRDRFQLLIEDNLEQLNEDLRGLKPAERIRAIVDLSKFVIPQLKATELSSTDNKISITIDSKDAQLGS